MLHGHPDERLCAKDLLGHDFFRVQEFAEEGNSPVSNKKFLKVKIEDNL
jgi:hypothetical protein